MHCKCRSLLQVWGDQLEGKHLFLLPIDKNLLSLDAWIEQCDFDLPRFDPYFHSKPYRSLKSKKSILNV